jgi:mannitol-specific phosphotransferase system IIBC component
MGSVNLHFFHPQLFTGYDGNLVTAAGRTAVIVGSQMEFIRTIMALPHGGYSIDNQGRTLQKSSLGAGFEAELQRFRDNTAQLANLQDNRSNAPPTGAALTNFNHALG